MIYLDYGATTPVNDEVMDVFVKVSKDYIGNSNSIHKLGIKSRNLMNETSLQIQKLLNVDHEVIFTSSATESNNLALFGVTSFYKKRKKKIIATKLSHSSVTSSLEILEKKGYEVIYVDLLRDGQIDFNHLSSLLKLEPILFTFPYVDSEVGVIQDLSRIKKLMKGFPKTILHVDATQAIGKIECDFRDVDLVSFSSHKIYGLKGIACLLRSNSVSLESIIHGGKSQSKYRSGTPALALMVSMAKALRLVLTDLEKNYNYVKELNVFLKTEISKFGDVVVNSDDNNSPYILNVSLINIKPETMIHALEGYDIFVSTKSACSTNITVSSSLLALSLDEKIASSSIRISLSHLTTRKEIIEFLNVFEKCFLELNFMKGEYN